MITKKHQGDEHFRSEESLQSAVAFLSEGLSLVPLLQAAELAEAQPISIGHSASNSGPPRQLRTFAFVFDVNVSELFACFDLSNIDILFISISSLHHPLPLSFPPPFPPHCLPLLPPPHLIILD